MNKNCSKCKQFAQFYSNKAHKNGLSSWCKSCEKQHTKEWRLKNGDRLKQNFYKMINEAKNKPCVDCFGWFEPCQMDFDHKDPTLKLIGVGLMQGYPRRTVLEEIKKCEVVCANCHRLRTQKQNYLKKVLPCKV